MGFINKLSALIPFGKKEEVLEYFFALNIESENLTAALWTIEKKELKILEVATETYNGTEEIIGVSDKLLDAVLGVRATEPQKILFGVPDNWLHEDNLKEEYLKLLRRLVKEFELQPMAYVALSHSLIHFFEKKEEVPTTAILVGIEENHITTTVARAGKLDGSKVIQRGDDLGVDIEKALLNFTTVETLPSKILLYGKDQKKLEKEKIELLSFPWMSKLSFLHLPKIEILQTDLAISSVALAGASEVEGDVVFKQNSLPPTKSGVMKMEEDLGKVEKNKEKISNVEEMDKQSLREEDQKSGKADFGFRVGDISKEEVSLGEESSSIEEELDNRSLVEESNIIVPHKQQANVLEQFEKKIKFPVPAITRSLKKFIPKRSLTSLLFIFGILLVTLGLGGAYLFLPKADVKVFVEPKILEKDAQVTADPKQKEIDEVNKVIPAQIVETDISGSDKETATGTKKIGDPAKGVVKIYNATSQKVSLSAGSVLTTDAGIPFTLDSSLEIASKSASAASPPTESQSTKLTAKNVGPDGNIPSGAELKVGNFSKSDVVAKSEGNFSGGTSKEITVVSDADQKRLLAKVASSLRQQAQQKLQEKLPDKKIIEEALSEEIVKRSFSKNINDQASEFTLNLTARYKGTAFEEKDLKAFVAKLVTTDVPAGFELDLEDTETQSDISKLEKDGKLVFLARFRAKLMPKINEEEIKDKIKGKTPTQALEVLKGIENVLGADITFTPNLPAFLQRLPLLDKNIKVEVGLK